MAKVSLPSKHHTADDRPEKIARAVEAYELAESPAWSDLDELSTHTIMQGIEVDPEGIILDKTGKFKGVMNVYVTLQYGKDNDEGFTTSDSFLGKFEGTYKDGNVTIERVEVDTSPFYK